MLAAMRRASSRGSLEASLPAAKK
jgi:hypothetical protein